MGVLLGDVGNDFGCYVISFITLSCSPLGHSMHP
jgi:hypothetical protein